MHKNIFAIQTEYKGIIFRSKSEAIFARCLDFWVDEDKNKIRHWLYEVGWSGKGTEKDFDFFITSSDKSNAVFRHLAFIEYKPSKPTETYLKKWRGKSAAVINKYKSILDYGLGSIECMLIAHNFFDEKNEAVVYSALSRMYGTATSTVQDSSYLDRAVKFTAQVLQYKDDAKSYRFDLQ